MVRLKDISKQFDVSVWEIIGYLYWQGKPVKIGNEPEYATIDSEQQRFLREYYVYTKIGRAVPEDSNRWFLGIIGPINDKSIYRYLISYDTSFCSLESERHYTFNTLDYEDCLNEEGNLNKEGTLVMFQRSNILGCNIALNIRRYNLVTDKMEVINLLFNGGRLAKSDKKELFYKSGIKFYELLKIFFEQKPSYRLEDNWYEKFRKFSRFLGLKRDLLKVVQSEYELFKVEYQAIYPIVQTIIHGVRNSVILRNHALYYILPREEVVTLIEEFKKKSIRYENNKTGGNMQTDLNALAFLRYQKNLQSMSFDTLCDELDKVYSTYSYLISEQHSDYIYEDTLEKDNWDAMTDGQYGDYPEEGFDGDYEFLGY